ncbi:13292_t:CDS:2, partial [Acaulospora colombiana]
NTKADAEQFNIVTCYQQFLKDDPDVSMPIAAIESLVELIKHSKANTLSEFMESLKEANQKLKNSVRNSISLSAGADLFLRFVTRTSHDVTNFEAYKEHLINSGKELVEKAAAVREKIAELGVQFIKDDAAPAAQKKRFKVYVTESRPTYLGQVLLLFLEISRSSWLTDFTLFRIRATKLLLKAGVPATVIYDAAVGYIIDKVDAVFVGAEGVVENGGLINAVSHHSVYLRDASRTALKSSSMFQIGTYQLAVVAKAANKPFYAVIESYKFVRLFPLNQYDLPTHTPDLLAFPDLEHHSQADELKQKVVNEEDVDIGDYEAINPTVDYTPPDYITLLCTDLGVLTPSGVSDELIKLYL